MTNIRLIALRFQFSIVDLLSNVRCFHRFVLDRKIYLGASIISLSIVNNSCTSDNKVSEDKIPDVKDSIPEKPLTDSLVENKELKKDTLIRLVKNKHKVLAELTKVAFDNSTIEVASCYAPIDVVEVPDNEPEIYTVAEEMPQFVGGDDSLKKYIATNLVWPTEAQEVEGTVYVGFIVETTGALTDISVKKGAHYLLDKEAIRLVKNMPKWKPGKQNGKAVRVSFVIPIRFKHQ